MAERKGNAPVASNIIPIDPSQLKVEISAGKQTASIFCLRKPKPIKMSNNSPRHKKQSSNDELNDSGSSGFFSDTMSVVSDISDLSAMSSIYSYNKLATPPPSSPRKSKQIQAPLRSSLFWRSQFLPGIHGRENQQKQGTTTNYLDNKKRFNKLQLTLERKDKAQAFSSHKQASAELRERNFTLEREIVNLKSQCSTLQELCDSMKDRRSRIQPEFFQTGNGMLVNHLSASKEKLFKAQDRILELESENSTLQVTLKNRDETLAKLEDRSQSLIKENLNLSSKGKSLENRVSELEKEVANALTGKVSAEHTLTVLSSERESLIKSRDWYREQMRQAQETRANVQRELMNAQKDNLSKTNQIERLKSSLSQSKRELEEEREKFLKEKSEIKRRLEDLEIDIAANQSSQSSGSQLEEENRALSSENNALKDEIKVLEQLKEEVEEREKRIEELNERLTSLAKSYTIASKNLEVVKMTSDNSKMELKEAQYQIEILKREIHAKEDLLSQYNKEKVELELVISSLKGEKLALNETIEKVKTDLSKVSNNFQALKTEMVRKDTYIEELKSERNLLKAENQQFQVDCTSVSETKLENLELKKKCLNLESLLKQNQELAHEIESLTLSNNILTAKIAEHEALKIKFEENLDKVREKDNLIKELQNRIKELQEAPNEEDEVFNESSADAPPDSERVLTLYLNEIDSLKERLAEKEISESDLKERLSSLEIDESEFANEILLLRRELEKVIRENHELKTRIEDNVIADDELKGLQSIKIARLESHISEYEQDITSLTMKLKEMESDILQLEKVNGTLASENVQVENLKTQLANLKDEFTESLRDSDAKIRDLSKEKTELLDQITRLEEIVSDTKSKFSKVNNALIIEKNESSSLRAELKSLKTGLEAANLLIDNLKSEKQTLKNETDRKIAHLTAKSASSKSTEVDPEKSEVFIRLKRELEEAKLCQTSLEDQMKNLNFHLQKKNSELESLKRMNETHSEEIRKSEEHRESLKAEISELKELVNKISEEKRKYKNQVHEMNSALKTCLNHLKELNASQIQADPLSTSSSPLPPCEESSIQDILKRCSRPTNIGRNLLHLRNCLATLKSEMGALQAKLDANSQGRSSSN